MLADACPSSCAEASDEERRQIVTLAFPSFRPELVRAFKIFLREMIRMLHDRNNGSFFDWKTIQIVVDSGFSLKQEGRWPIAPHSFLLKIVNVCEIFEVFVAVVIVFHESVDFLSNFSFDLRVLGH